MKLKVQVFFSALFMFLGIGTTNAGPPSASPVCALKCPEGYVVASYSWEIHPERTNYDEQGKVQVPPDAVWHVSCALRCEQHAVNEPTKSWKDKKDVCDSGGEPKPYSGPWRLTGQFTRECDARFNNGCSMRCYPIRAQKPAAKGKIGKGRAK